MDNRCYFSLGIKNVLVVFFTATIKKSKQIRINIQQPRCTVSNNSLISTTEPDALNALELLHLLFVIMIGF